MTTHTIAIGTLATGLLMVVVFGSLINAPWYPGKIVFLNYFFTAVGVTLLSLGTILL